MGKRELRRASLTLGASQVSAGFWRDQCLEGAQRWEEELTSLNTLSNSLNVFKPCEYISFEHILVKKYEHTFFFWQ